MTDFQSAFDTNTSGINTTLTTQLSSVQQWANIPGSLVKASSSQAGYLWGFNSVNKVWVCQQPCTGSWSEVSLTKLVTPASPAVAATAPIPTGGATTYMRISGWNGSQDKNHISLGTGANNGSYSLMICFGRTVAASSQNMSGSTVPAIEAIINGVTKQTNQLTITDRGYSLTPYNVTSAQITPDLYIFNVTIDQPSYNYYLKTILPAQPETNTMNFDIAIIPTSPGKPAVPATSAGSISAILDIATDETNVYLLFNSEKGNALATKTANNQTDWAVIPIGNNFAPTNIFSTHTYLWLQTATNQKVKIPKPINMTNTMPHPDTSVKITSSSASALYGVDGTGKAMKSDETLQTGWSAVSGLTGTTVKSVVGDLDQQGLFIIDNNSRVSECVGDCSTNKTVPVNTQGYLPLYMTADPSTKQLWMTSSTAGSRGNIFNRVGNPDYSSILNTVTPLDQNRDKVIGDVKDEYNKQTQVMTVNKQIGDFHDLFAKIFGDATKATQETNTEISKVETDVVGKQMQLKTITNIEPIIQKLVVTLATAALVYAIFSFLGWIVHAIVLVVIGVGIYLSLNNDINLSSLWARLP